MLPPAEEPGGWGFRAGLHGHGIGWHPGDGYIVENWPGGEWPLLRGRVSSKPSPVLHLSKVRWCQPSDRSPAELGSRPPVWAHPSPMWMSLSHEGAFHLWMPMEFGYWHLGQEMAWKIETSHPECTEVNITHSCLMIFKSSSSTLVSPPPHLFYLLLQVMPISISKSSIPTPICMSISFTHIFISILISLSF